MFIWRKISSLFVIFISISVIILVSCKKGEDGVENNYQEMSVSPYGDEVTLSLSDGNWTIETVTNFEGGNNIFGDIFRADGSLLVENKMLRLEESGKLVADFSGRNGFEIVKNEKGDISITTFENLSDKPFHFVIKLKKGEESKEIAVRQDISEGYVFESIAYHQSPEDYDSVYSQDGARIKTTMTAPSEIRFDPLKNGMEKFVTSYFVPERDNRYKWPNQDSVKVDVPDDIVDGELILSGNKKRIYGIFSKDDVEIGGQEIKVDVPAGQSSFYISVEWRKLQLSYTLVLKHKKQDIKKILKGKWIEISPTGNYQLVWDK